MVREMEKGTHDQKVRGMIIYASTDSKAFNQQPMENGASARFGSGDRRGALRFSATSNTRKGGFFGNLRNVKYRFCQRNEAYRRGLNGVISSWDDRKMLISGFDHSQSSLEKRVVLPFNEAGWLPKSRRSYDLWHMGYCMITTM